MRFGKPSFISSHGKYFHGKTEVQRCPIFNPPFYDRYVDDCFSKKKKRQAKSDDQLECLNISKHFLTISSTLLSLVLISSTAKSTRNKENYQRIGNEKSLPKGKDIVLLAPSTERNSFLLILTTMSKQLKRPFLSAGYSKGYISHTLNGFLKDPPEDDNLIPNFLFEERNKIIIKDPLL